VTVLRVLVGQVPKRRRGHHVDPMLAVLGSVVRGRRQGELVTVSGLLPGTRYNFRQRTRPDVEFDQCPVSDTVQTKGKKPVPLSRFFSKPRPPSMRAR
jgi:hypothetical protein